ncbi:MAG: tetratricopeptide repeat protein, partial [Anaerolineaceae bacterium]|nr:tetratricopeptide repeat protein [Anaerolineaceae bacterium]
MARIPLRLYTKEIETLIEKGSIDEAIAHIKYILKIYPKHIESYRLLGKAFLESQKYTEASDILQRVLSVFPDDFISQIGMSIVREDEGNLDAAIWHMERAFEVQPANNAVQDELKRLYGRRDGVAPAKVRLTSGALIRMYARGDLYAQAISEILAVMKDDPKRQDLEVILARMYYLSDQKQKSVQ